MNIASILKQNRIEYFTSGPNIGRGQIGVRCPICGYQDPSAHCVIQTATNEWYCRRCDQGGYRIGYLLKLLGINTSGMTFTEYDWIAKAPKVVDERAGKYFEPAETSEKAIAYLETRLFSDPVSVAERFKLKIAPNGHWANRLIIPLTVGWTGRSTNTSLQRFEANTNQDGFFYYSQNSSSVIITEGAIDSMKVAQVSSQCDVVAKCRIMLSAAIINHLMRKNYSSVYCAFDSDVDLQKRRDELKYIQNWLSSAKVREIGLQGHKDFGECTESEVRKLLLQVH